MKVMPSSLYSKMWQSVGSDWFNRRPRFNITAELADFGGLGAERGAVVPRNNM